MSTNTYDSGRLNLPFVGHCTFAKQPVCLDWQAIDADVAVLGVPFDMGTQYRPGARFGPRAIREASTLFSFGHSGAYDHEDDVTYLPADAVRIVDVGDADIIHTDTLQSHANTEAAVRQILKCGAMPLILGGDHAVHAPCIAAFSDQEPVHIAYFDAHLDFVDERHGVGYGHGNPLRRASEMDWVTSMTQMGIPKGVRYYVTINIDGFDPSIAPGTGTPSHGGFLYYEVLEILQGLAKQGDVVGIDLVKVAPDYDPAGITAFLAAQILMNFLGFNFHKRQQCQRPQA